ncbi:hypothetical protein SUGI_1145310 [Cryptomeria japonica]|uniref:uncharacterized protein LOC131069643 n=1 Tax=Cryptomeria japonica TaxID=3369 RepID=UPI002414CC47|nr:uncharacterized protein LOC131069643 [Cryptomeria japonica]GLJ53685.1 hypothetical protein SUGI_1145310 [Cryptomeria japonica]
MSSKDSDYQSMSSKDSDYQSMSTMSTKNSDSERSDESTLNTESTQAAMLKKEKAEIEFTGWKPTLEQLAILEWHYQQGHCSLALIFNKLKVYGHVKCKNIARWFAWRRHASGHVPVPLYSIPKEDIGLQMSMSSYCSNKTPEESSNHKNCMD